MNLLVNQVLRTVREDYPDAFIAGGAIRDYLLGYKPKDIDVFTFQQNLSDEKTISPESDEWTDFYAAFVDRLLFVANRDGFDLPVQIIGLSTEGLAGENINTPAFHVARFALGIQQAWYDGKLHMLPAFEKDARERTLTVTWCESITEAIAIRKKIDALLEEKCRGFKVVIPERVGEYSEVLSRPYAESKAIWDGLDEEMFKRFETDISH